MSKQRLQIPAQMLQNLMRGPMQPDRPPDVVEVMTENQRLTFNADAVEKVRDRFDDDEPGCAIKLKGDTCWINITTPYDDFLKALSCEPRKLYDLGG